MLNSPKFVQTRNPNLSNWSSLQRRLRGLTANDLLSTFGDPWIRANHHMRSTSGHYMLEHGLQTYMDERPRSDEKVTLEWHFLDTYGRLVTLYDYKQNAAGQPDTPVSWSIGGFDPEPAEEFEAWLLAQIPTKTEATKPQKNGLVGTGYMAEVIAGPRSDDDQFETDEAMAGWDTCRTECTHCNGFGSSLKEAAARCTKCGGSGLVE